MKKLLSVLILFIMFVSTAISAFAEDGFLVRNTVIKVNEGIANINIHAPYFEGFNQI